MRGQTRDRHIARRHVGPLLSCALAALAACAGGGGSGRDHIYVNEGDHVWVAANPRDPSEFVDLTPAVERFQSYVRALGGFETEDPAVWQRSVQDLCALPAGTLTPEESQLIVQAVLPEGAQARRLLAESGRMYRQIGVFTREFDAETWAEAYEDIRAMGPEAVEYLVNVLWLQLLQPWRSEVHDDLRLYIVRCGEPGLDRARALIAAASERASSVETVEGYSFNPMEMELTRCYEVLLQFGDMGREDVARAASHRHPNVRMPLALAVKNLRAGDRIDLVARLCRDADWGVRAAAVETLGSLVMIADDATALAVEALQDEEPLVAGRALQAISDLRASGDHVGPRLLEMLSSEDPQVRARAVEALGAVRYAPAFDMLVRVANAQDPTGQWRDERLAAITALGRLGDERAVDTLMRLLDSPDVSIVNTAILALQGVTGTRLFRPEAWRRWYAARNQ